MCGGSSFYVIHREEDALDRLLWNRRPSPPQPDESLWSGSPESAACFDAGWIKVTVNPDPNAMRPYKPGTVFAFEYRVDEALAPIRITTKVCGVVEIDASQLEGNNSASAHSNKKGKERAGTDRHALVLDSAVTEMTFLGPNAYTLDDPIKNPIRQTYRIPDRGTCACQQGRRSLSSTCESGPVQVRYWFEMTGQRLTDERERLEWKGKGRAPEVTADEPLRVSVPVRLIGDWQSRRLLSTSADDDSLEVSTTIFGVQTVRHFAPNEQPSFVKGVSTPSMTLTYMITTSEAHTPSLICSLQVSFGSHFKGEYADLWRQVGAQAFTATYQVVRVTSILCASSGEKALVGTASSEAALVKEERLGKVWTVSEHNVCAEPQPGLGRQKDEVLTKLYAEVILAMSDYGAELSAQDEKDGIKTIPPVRVQSCQAEVRYDLIAELHHPSTDQVYRLRAVDIAIGQVATGLSLSQKVVASRDVLSSQPSVPSALGSVGGQATPNSILPAATCGDDLPAYEAPAGGTDWSLCDEKRHAGASDSLEVVLAREAAPPNYLAETAPAGSSASTAQYWASHTTSERQSRPSFLSRVFTRGNRSTAQSESDPNANVRGTLRIHPASVVAPPSPLPPHEQGLPPSWEESVRDDMVEEWAVASVALGAAEYSNSRSDGRGGRRGSS